MYVMSLHRAKWRCNKMVFHGVLSKARGGSWPCKIPIASETVNSEGLEMCSVQAANESPPCVATAAASWHTGERAISACMLVETRNNPVTSWSPNSNVSRCGGVFSLARARQEREREDNVVHAPILRHKIDCTSRGTDTLDACAERMRRFDCMVSGVSPTTAIFPSIVSSCITASSAVDTATVSNAVAVSESTSVRQPRGSAFALISQQANSKEQRRHEIVNRASELDRRLTLKNPKSYPAGLHAHHRADSDGRNAASSSRQEIAMVPRVCRTSSATEPRRRLADGHAPSASEW